MKIFSFINRLLAVCIMLLSTNSVFAAVKQQDAAKAQQLLSKSIRGFEENKGQIVDQYHQPNADVHYLFRSPGLNVQLRNNGFSYDSYRDEIQDNGKDESSLSIQRDIPHSNREVNIEHKDITRHIHRVDIELVGANAHPIMTALSALPSMNNYYKGDKNIENVRSYERVIYTNIYPSIDLEFFISTEGKPEYQFYVRPGGDAKNIRLRYNGALKTYLSDGKIMMDVAHGSIAEHIPLSYLSQSKEEVTVRYKQIGTNEFGCEAPSYSATETLVIDPMPQLSWGTYYGMSGEHWWEPSTSGQNVSLDHIGNVYVTGATSNTGGIATTGAYQVTLGGSSDGFIAKFNSNGVRLWATYYGGLGSEGLGRIVFDENNNMYSFGSTTSTSGIATSGAHQTIRSGTSDGFIVKFNSNGERLWGTYFGGTGSDQIFNIANDAVGNIYIVGGTTSTNGIATSGTHQPTRSGTSDGFVIKFNNNGVRLWGTYCGGSSSDRFLDVGTDSSGNVYCFGETSSTSGIATNGAFKTTLSGPNDCYLVKFNSNGARLWGTYYGGGSEEYDSRLAIDENGDIYCSGLTGSTDDIATQGTHKPNFEDVSDGFIVKFNSNGARLWGTYYGGENGDYIGSITTDNAGYIYIAGGTESQNGITTSGAFQENSDYGGSFIAKFTSNGLRQWGTYCGGSRLYDIAVDDDGNIYCVGESGSSDNNVITEGAYQTTRGGYVDTFIAKFVQPSSELSDVIVTPNFTYSTNIPYNLYQAGSLTSANSLAFMGITIRDGGEQGDEDDKPTILTSLTLSLTPAQFIHKIALFDGDMKIAEADGSANISFIGLHIVIDDNSSKDLLLRVSYTASLEDNIQHSATVIEVTSAITGSIFALPDGGGATSSIAGDINRLEVTADRLRFVTQPSDVNVGIAMQPAVTVESVDALYNRDLDVEGREVFISNRMLNDAPVAALADEHGIATFRTLTFHTPSLLEQLTASSPGYEAALSNSFAILCTGMTLNTIVHYDAATLSSADGTPLAMWSDVACYNDNAVQNNPPSRPLYRNNGMDNINNYPVVRFSFGRALSMAGSQQVNGGTAKTVFAVFRTGNQVISRQVITELGGLSSGFNLYIQNSRIYGGAWDNASLWVSQPIMPNRVYLAQFVYDGTRLRLSVSEQGASTSITQSAFNDNSIAALRTGNGIGSAFRQTRYHNGPNISAGHSDFFTNHIAEIIIMNSSDVDERSFVFDSLNTKYAIGALSNPLLKEIEEELVEEYTEATPSLSVYPNPVHNSSSIYYHVPVSGDYSVVLQDVLGNTVMEIVKGTQNSGTYSTELHADALMSGMYRLVLTTSMGTISTPIVIQK